MDAAHYSFLPLATKTHLIKAGITRQEGAIDGSKRENPPIFLNKALFSYLFFQPGTK